MKIEHFLISSSIAATPASSLWIKLVQRIEKVVLSILTKCFFVGYEKPAANQVVKNLIVQRQAYALDSPLETLYIPSKTPNRTGNVIVITDTTSFQDRLERALPKQYRYFLECGADVLLWNPTQPTPKEYGDGLLSLLKILKKKNPDQKIVMKGHCATVEPSISAAASFNDPSVSLLLDRGYADVFALSRSFTVLSTIPFIKRLIVKHFSCEGMQKLKTVPGKIIFVAPEDKGADQVLYWKGKNLTYEMEKYRKENGFFEDAFIKLGKNSDHWSRWDEAEYIKIINRLVKTGVVVGNCLGSIPKTQRPAQTFFQKTCLPLLTKAWC